MGIEGVEPSSDVDFESTAYANSAISPIIMIISALRYFVTEQTSRGANLRE